MAYSQHTPVNPERMASTALAAVEESLVLPNVGMQKESIDQFKGAANGAVNVKVEGVLPYREYGWKNDRTNPITFDTYAERTTSVNFQGDIYSGVALIDEQATMDNIGWDRLAVKQGEAVGRGIERKALAAVTGETYDVGVRVFDADMRAALIYLRRVAGALKVPGRRVLAVSPDFEMALLSDPDLTIAANVGDARAAQAVQDATLGRLLGFDIVVAPELPANSAYLFIDNAFVVASGAPVVPASIKAAGTKATPNGFAVRWLQDYDADRLTDRSVLNSYVGFRAIKDPVITFANDAFGNPQAAVSTNEYLIRAVEIELASGAGTNAVEIADGTLASFMGMTSTDGTNDKATDATPTPGATV
jgi:hypothetical protein